MSKIQILDPVVANRIAAGEVVERPASLAKELCENALDAGATEIVIQAEEGGCKRLSVWDNGCGMDLEDARLAFAPHATSKLKQIEDLDVLATMGFRGEALASIASVSKVDLLTRTAEDSKGIRLPVEGGVLGEIEPVGCPVGTQIQISDLFYNTPARLKFLKKTSTEASKITDMVQKLALSRPDVRFVLRQDGRSVLETPGNGELLSCIQAIFGAHTAQELIELPQELDLTSEGELPIVCTGYIGQPASARNNRNQQLFFVNNRVFRSTLLYRAIDEAYKGRLMKGKHPFVLLQLYLPQNQVDINVHPQKMEVRFGDEQRIYRQIYHILCDALDQAALPPGDWSTPSLIGGAGGVMQGGGRLQKDPFEAIWPHGAARRSTAPTAPITSTLPTPPTTPSLTQEESPIQQLLPLDPLPLAESSAPIWSSETVGEEVHRFKEAPPLDLPEEKGTTQEPDENPAQPLVLQEQRDWSSCRPSPTSFGGIRPLHTLPVIGQAFGTYILLQDQDCIWMLDQHAAHEKILFERLLKQYSSGSLQEQPLLFPLPVELSPKDLDFTLKHLELFTSIGYQIEPFADQQIVLRSQPADSTELDPRSGFLAALDYFSQEVQPNQSFTLQQEYDLLAEVACKAAIKGNTQYSAEEIRVLLEQLETLEHPLNCPHGRPIVIRLSRQEIEKWFKRIL